MTDLSVPQRPAVRADAPAASAAASPNTSSNAAPNASPADAAPGRSAPGDAELVARVARGDAEALGLLYDRHGAACLALARAVTGSPDDAEDVAADAFAQLWRTAGRYDPARGSVAAWVVTVARTRALDHVRARRRRARAEERAADDLPLAVAEPADPGSGEAAGRVRRAVAALPAPQRDAVLLAFFGGLTHTAVAERLGEPLGTVKTRIRAGLQKLRAALRPLAPDPREGDA